MFLGALHCLKASIDVVSHDVLHVVFPPLPLLQQLQQPRLQRRELQGVHVDGAVAEPLTSGWPLVASVRLCSADDAFALVGVEDWCDLVLIERMDIAGIWNALDHKARDVVLLRSIPRGVEFRDFNHRRDM